MTDSVTESKKTREKRERVKRDKRRGEKKNDITISALRRGHT